MKVLLGIVLCLAAAPSAKINIAETDISVISSEQETEQWDENTETVKQFLEKYFQLNASEDKISFYEKLAPYMSEEGLHSMMSRRMPVKYMDMLADDETICAEEIVITETEERLFREGKLYHFEMELKKATEHTDSEETLKITITGQVSADADGKMENVYVQETPQFAEFLSEDFGLVGTNS